MKNGEPSLRFLQRRIRDQYSSLLKRYVQLDSEIDRTASVVLVLDSIEDHFEKVFETRNIEASTSSGEVNGEEIKLVKRLFDESCDPALFEKSGIEEFLKGKLNRNTAVIAFSPNTAPLEIVMGCLRVIVEMHDKEIKPLLKYAIHYFLIIFSRLTSLWLIQPKSVLLERCY